MKKKLNYQKYLGHLKPIFFNTSNQLRTESSSTALWVELTSQYKTIGKNTYINVLLAIKHDRSMLKLKERHLNKEFISRYKELPVFKNYSIAPL